MAVIVSDATVLIALARLGQFDLLRKLWNQIIIPQAVHREVLRGVVGRTETEKAVASRWMKVRPVEDKRAALILSAVFGRGEAECLVLAKEMNASLLLLDEKRVRNVARRAGFDVMGVLGLLVRAARQGYFDSRQVVEMIDILRSSGFRLGDEVVKSALSALKK